MAGQGPDYLMDGDPTPWDEPTPPTGGLTRIRPPTLSPTGGRQPTAPTPSSATGVQPSGRGAAVTPLGRWVVQQLGPFALPEETMRSMSSSLLSHLETATSDRFGPDGQFDGVGLGPFRILVGASPKDLQQDLARLDATCQPATKSEAAHEVAKLMVRTKSRLQGDGEARLMAETMVDDLRAYPADVVKFACEYWVDGGREAKFTPSWPELKEICEKRMEGRLRLRRAIVHHLGSNP